MTALLRIIGIGAGGLLVWSAAASQVVDRTRLPATSVVEGAVITQPFGCTTLVLEPFDLFCPSRHMHTGIDLAAPGGRPVHAATGGTARVGYSSRGAGLYVVIAYDAHVRILYCHLLRSLVASGDQVSVGELIGLVGTSGLTTGPHLHLEIQVDGHPVDPIQWLAAPTS